MILVSELKRWLGTLADDDAVGIDEGCSCLVSDQEEGVYIEVGGMPLDEEE